MNDTLNLFDFGTNADGEYVNLAEEERIKSDIKESEFREWLQNHDNPLVRLAYDFLIPFSKLEKLTFNELKEELEWIAEQKIYHYGNMEKDLYIYTIFSGDCWCFIFENDKHIMANLNYIYSQKELEQYLFGNNLIQFNALSVRVYDLNGNKIEEYGEKEKDIRHQCVIKEWKMNEFGSNRMKEGKKITDFYEVELSLPKLIEYWGDS